MPYTRNIDYRYVSNSRVSSRTKQVLILVAVILIGMIVSASVNAIPSGKNAKVEARASISQSTNVRQ